MSDRHAFRAKWHDYNRGVYFVTICTHNKVRSFGTIAEGMIQLSELGRIVDANIRDIPVHFPTAEVWNYVVMPNHIHIVLAVGARYIAPVSTKNKGCLRAPEHGTCCHDYHHNSLLSTIISTFKASVTRTARARFIAPLQPIWQRLYHEHIIRNQAAFENIMNYIDSNVENWCKDCFNDE